MKLLYAISSIVLLSACEPPAPIPPEQFTSVTLDIQCLDVNKEIALTRNGAQFQAIIQEIEFEFENGVLVGSEQSAEIFGSLAANFNLGDELINEIEAGGLVINADKLYDSFEFNLVAVRYQAEADLDANQIFETILEVEIQDINEVLLFENLGINSLDKNIDTILQFDPQGLLDGADLQQLVVAQGVNVNSAITGFETLTIDVDTAANEVDIALGNIVDPAKGFVEFVFTVKDQL